MVLNAVSKMKSKVQALPTLKLLLPVAQRKVQDFSAQEIANTLNAMSKLEHYDKAVFEVLLSEAQRPWSSGSSASHGVRTASDSAWLPVAPSVSPARVAECLRVRV